MTQTRHGRLTLWMPLIFVILVSIACSLPSLSRQTAATPTPTATEAPTTTPALPTPTPQTLPPAVVEIDPYPGTELSLDGSITFYFNQPMDRQSVETALQEQSAIAGSYSWVDDTTLTFTPNNPLQPESEVNFELGTGAQSTQGLALTLPVNYRYQTAGYLRLTHVLPEADANEVNPTSAVVANFNYPVVPLGADPSSLPVGFNLEPGSQGHGAWINTSTYIFYPEPALEGGKAYTVRINSELKGVNGSPLAALEDWSFTTAQPRLVSVEPSPDTGAIRLDSKFVLIFNQPMDPANVEASFTLTSPDTIPVPGKFEWSEKDTQLTFTPNNLLTRDTTYTLGLNGSAQARGGTSLGESTQFYMTTVPALAVTGTDPQSGGIKQEFASVTLFLSAPLGAEDVEPYVTVTPGVTNMGAWWNEYDRSINIYGDFLPDTEYSASLSPELPDPWGGRLGQQFSFNFRSASLSPNIFLGNGLDVMFLTTRDAFIPAQVTNITNLPMTLGSVTLPDFVNMVSKDDSYQFRQNYTSRNQQSWQQPIDVPPNRAQEIFLPISPDENPLRPGLYVLRIASPQSERDDTVVLLVVSDIHLTFKLSATDALVWAVDLQNNQSVPNDLITILDRNGAQVASGETDADGVFQGTVPVPKDPYYTQYAITGLPGEEGFGLALSTWNQGTNTWNFGITSDYNGPALKAYIYTDRPIYRPGQTVYFRAVVRNAYNGRYTLPDISSLPLTLYWNYGEEIANFNLPLSEYGTAHGEYTLPENAQPGDYRLGSTLSDYGINLNFRVAEYRKPEINLQVDFNTEQVLAGDTLTAQVNARYFFDAPAGNLPVQWVLMDTPSNFTLPGYQVGIEDTSWLDAIYLPNYGYATQIDHGEATTDPQGLLTLEFPTGSVESRRQYSLEVTVMDESGLPISARDSVDVNPAAFSIGVRPETWVGRAGEESGFDVVVVDWDQNPAGSQKLLAEFQKVEWVRDDSSDSTFRFYTPVLKPVYTPIASTDFSTNDQGQARIAFTPPEPGTYQLDVSGGGARTQVLLWVGGPGQVTWPNLPDQRLHLTADRKDYQPGDTAQIFIPNPYTTDTLALLTIERGIVLRHQVESIPAGGSTFSLPLTSDEAPNVYLSVTLIGRDEAGLPDYYQGYLNIPVEPVEQTLEVSLTSQPERAGPGDDVTYDVLVRDSNGDPVQGEFSLAVVDLAALALADPNAPDIVPAFYANQPLGVRTGLPLGAYPKSSSQPAGGGGGGGDGSIPPVVRERFPDTAYWNAEIVTDQDGRAQVTLTLPDNLTTWQASARGVAADTRVGQDDSLVITSKDLLVRPVTPRFLVVGDHLQAAVIAQNNTPSTLQANVAIQANGFMLDDPAAAAQQVSIPANGRVRVDWWGTVQDVETVDLIFSAEGAGLQDAARPAGGKIPVLHYTAPQTFSTAGVLEEGGQRIELVSLPRSYDMQDGTLRVEAASTLAGSAMTALDVLETYPYQCTEQTLSRFLPNLEMYRVMQAYGKESPSVRARLERTLVKGLEQLQAYQNTDGGWSWWQGGVSDPYVTSYALFGLLRARESGAPVSQPAIQRGVDYLLASLAPPEFFAESWQLDRHAFVHYVLANAGSGNLADALALYQLRDRLNPWAQALLALTIEKLSPGSAEAQTLVSDLESSAIRSATGAHWEEREPGYSNMSTPVSTTAMVVYALTQLDPGAPVSDEATRYLAAHRQADGAWGSTYSTAWTVMAFAEMIRSTGELEGNFAFTTELNNLPLSSGQAGGEGAPVSSEVPIGKLYPDYPNALSIQREAGSGRLYYTAALNVNRPVEDVAPLDQGISVSRVYQPYAEACPQNEDCPAIHQAQAGTLVKVRVQVTLKEDTYYLVVEDYLPAGTEILNTNLKTSKYAIFPDEPPPAYYDESDPFGNGWGWWLFNDPSIFDDHIAWAVDYLPAGTYELTYDLSVLQPGEFRVLPARAWQFYFPEIQGNSDGEIFTVTP